MSARASRRQVLAILALQADLPAPQLVEFVEDNGRLGIHLDRVADLHAWLPYFGMTAKDVSAQPYTHKIHPDAGRTSTLANAYSSGEWRGWRVHLNALDPVGEPEPALDEQTREQLQSVADTEDGAPC